MPSNRSRTKLAISEFGVIIMLRVPSTRRCWFNTVRPLLEFGEPLLILRCSTIKNIRKTGLRKTENYHITTKIQNN